ncbi:hypothetical protein A2625_01400 [candidate division WOR-1 bacterium RIFCSPHIGHO2_01_FULL_53_15]|uniref:Uncharacterized protein n=1 Tax=candidate division WOR-1 bacterium RIFCSPHIGHO2_01_FULL_53_15 TaxID=1802564 RepID=A0A1F4Q369_UNCSA|nr:MAG: hypothetical protein A2625_01400 [candidate division WOR-1 bacterium RIFCSPHIGHO2_01_FULL_53_15]OGC13349.1 MAG: hypothetical protein A3D23_00910 [candidate division WOR-1 bacterium RIFCSPHIGHO2_02_FULL_53_26]
MDAASFVSQSLKTAGAYWLGKNEKNITAAETAKGIAVGTAVVLLSPLELLSGCTSEKPAAPAPEPTPQKKVEIAPSLLIRLPEPAKKPVKIMPNGKYTVPPFTGIYAAATGAGLPECRIDFTAEGVQDKVTTEAELAPTNEKAELLDLSRSVPTDIDQYPVVAVPVSITAKEVSFLAKGSYSAQLVCGIDGKEKGFLLPDSVTVNEPVKVSKRAGGRVITPPPAPVDREGGRPITPPPAPEDEEGGSATAQ